MDAALENYCRNVGKSSRVNVLSSELRGYICGIEDQPEMRLQKCTRESTRVRASRLFPL